VTLTRNSDQNGNGDRHEIQKSSSPLAACKVEGRAGDIIHVAGVRFGVPSSRREALVEG